MPVPSPVTGVAVPLLGAVVLGLALLALLVWYRTDRARRRHAAPELTDDTPEPPDERDDTWDPRRRYSSEQ